MPDAAALARAVWEHAAGGCEPRVFELAGCDCGKHVGHIVREHRPVNEAHVISTVQDLVCLADTVALAVWTVTSQPYGSHMLFVLGSERPVALVGTRGFAPRTLEVVTGLLFSACLAALTPVPADDPLVVELAGLAGGR